MTDEEEQEQVVVVTTNTTTATTTTDFGFSQIPGTPSFRNASVNTVAIVPLLSSSTTTTTTTSLGDGGNNNDNNNNNNNNPTRATTTTTHSIKSFYDLLNSLQKHSYCTKSSNNDPTSNDSDNDNDNNNNSLLLVVPNNTLTRPGDWRYSETPYSSFHWQHGCQRIQVIDGRPISSREAHDKLLNPDVSRNWIDLYPSRRTAAVVGVLSLQDCTNIQDFHKAEEELRNWCMQYSTPPYAVTLHGSDYPRDIPVVRMFVYDSFTENSVDLSNSIYLGSNRIVAFPPSTGDSNLSTNIHLMNLHLNVVINDLAVAIFRNLENKVKEYQDLVAASIVQAQNTAAENNNHTSKQSAARRTIQRFVSGATSSSNTSTHTRQIPIEDDNDTSTVTSTTVATTLSSVSSHHPPASGPKNLTIGNMASLVNPESKLAKDSPTNAATATSSTAAGGSFPGSSDSGSGNTTTTAVTSTVLSQKIPKLLTPLDDESLLADTGRSPTTALSADAIRKREIGRREKWCGDISLLAGSPLDAYEHYLKAAELLSTKIMGAGSAATNVPTSLDPLWHACALEGCAAAHIAMADCGGYNVDEYLENNFQLPEEVMVVLLSYQAAVAAAAAASSSSSTTSEGNDIPAPPKKVPTNKQTLPEVVFTLCEESLSILSRNQNLAHLYAELLLKLARYTADSAEGHLRCQWGNGPGCYSGTFVEDDGPTSSSSSGNGDNIPRWMKTSTNKLLALYEKGTTATGRLPPPSGLNDMAMVNTLYRSRKICELLHKAVAIGSLDPATRVDVAAQSTVLCLNGLKPTNWRGLKVERMKLPRKAAFFSTVAAETFCLANKPHKARDLWLLSTQLYTRTPNPCDGYIGGTYGWASLRAHCLEALSMQGNSRISLEAGLELLSLLSELQPEKRRKYEERLGLGTTDHVDHSKTPKTKNSRSDDLARYNDSISSLKDENDSDRGTSGGTGGLRNDFGLSLDEAEIREAVANAARNLRDNYRLTLANASALLSNQTKWTEGEPIPSVLVPFADLASLPTGLTTLKSVWPVTDYTTCVYAQKHCLDRIASLRRSLPTLSGFEAESYSIYGGTIGDGQKLPLYVTSAMAIQVDPALEMECVKKVIVPDKSKEGAMATFFNPYEAKKKEKSSTIRVAEEEERAMRITFGNRLSLPLEIRRSQLEFLNDTEGRVKAASLSFIIPARAKGFTVQFPFTILSRPTESGDGHDDNSTELEVKGLDLTCFGRSFFLPIQELSDTSTRTETGNLPESASVYPYRSTKKTTVVEPDSKPRVETFPCQPRLHVLIAESGAPVDRFSIGLSDGEIYTLPKFRLENYMGPNARGKIERLQIYSANVPGTSDKKLYDSDAGPVDDINEADFVKDLIWKENAPPLLLRVLVGSLKLNSINGNTSSDSSEEDTVTFQIAAAHNLGEKIPKGTTLHIRFRYRGLSSSSTEVWRKKEIVLQIRHAKGPRISSVAFRHDLSIESALAEMSLSRPTSKPTKLVKKATTNEDDARNNNEFAALRRVGLDNEIGICGDKSYFVLTVANETKSVLTLERGDGPVGGFERSPLLTITVRPGVSAKIPFVINRLPRIDADGNPVDIISELVARTSLIWKSHRGGEAGPVKARGNIRIPPACLKDIISRHPSFVSHICQAPCSLDLVVGKPVASNSELRTVVGEPISVSVNVNLESWVPKEAIDNSSLVVEFRCGRKRLHGASSVNTSSTNKEYCWSGKLRHAMPMNSSNKKHSAKIVFCVAGRYAVSACAKISQKGSASEEVWWAPIAQSVIVE